MSFNVVTPQTPLPPSILHQLALGSPLDEISNYPGGIRHHIFYHGDRKKKTNKLERSMLFFVYQTGRFGPQNGFRLCLVHQGFHIASATKGEEGLEDDIDRLERDIPQGHIEIVVLGEAPVYVNDEDGGHITPHSPCQSQHTDDIGKSSPWASLWAETYQTVKDDPEHSHLLETFETYLQEGKYADLADAPAASHLEATPSWHQQGSVASGFSYGYYPGPVSFSEDGRLVYFAAHEWVPSALMRVETGECIKIVIRSKSGIFSTWTQRAQGSSLGGIEDMALSPDGKLLVSVTDEGCVKLHDADTLEVIGGFYAPGTITSVAFCRDSKRFASYGTAGLQLWDTSSMTNGQPMKAPASFGDLMFLPNSDDQVLSCLDGEYRLWDASGGHALEGLFACVLKAGTSREPRFSQDGTRGVLSSPGKLRIFDMKTAEEILVPHPGLRDLVFGFSPNGQFIWCWSRGMQDFSQFQLWDLGARELRLLRELKSLDQLWHVSADCVIKNDGLITGWNTDYLSEKFSLEGTSFVDDIWSLVMTPTGKLAVLKQGFIGGPFPTLHLWEIATGEEIGSYGIEGRPGELWLSEDDRYLTCRKGRLPLPSSLPNDEQSDAGKFQEDWQDLLYVGEQWVYQGLTRLLWLPSQYQNLTVTARGETVAFGQGDLGVQFIKFDLAKTPLVIGRGAQ
ncbi:uncharacterized protein NECHADRAFT_75696 [Fusarium vanettenii 77-13-4]|uniref:Mitochondrial division protein 1 n=1 Tax=Fusarium vanettenii (strain ATCC MYA-4622 / CBS 123669 / FGSC 9596 / NRRL 45880 / 77-13-4) TaxID=660122 RepID=C7YJJ1_FUSV7|nr:uncharacterized protein NECHADRAFT_75696 [Fusarium vanettenii 77-13-4]EEU48984.1 hypothetical protein NECHADRAFT_75696 [Fusarium vanettenii 77-13-4]